MTTAVKEYLPFFVAAFLAFLLVFFVARHEAQKQTYFLVFEDGRRQIVTVGDTLIVDSVGCAYEGRSAALPIHCGVRTYWKVDEPQ